MVLYSDCISLHSHQQYRRVLFSPCRLSDDGGSDQCEMILHFSFDLYLPCVQQRHWASFHVPDDSVFGEMSFQVFCPLKKNKKKILSCISCLYILEINPLSGYFICKYIFLFCGLPFRFVYGFLCCAKAFKFNQAPFVYFCFCFHYFRRQIQKNIAAVYV